MGEQEIQPAEGWPQVRRSLLDPTVWFADVRGHDMHDIEHPGGMRAVKAWVEVEYATGLPVQWVRVDEDTWEMRWTEEGTDE